MTGMSFVYWPGRWHSFFTPQIEDRWTNEEMTALQVLVKKQNQESKNMTSRTNSYSNLSIPSLVLQDSELLCFPGTRSQLLGKCKVRCTVSSMQPWTANGSLFTLKLPVFLQNKGWGIDGCNLSKLETRKVNSACLQCQEQQKKKESGLWDKLWWAEW